MDLQRSANIAQILSFFPGAYSAYGTFVLLHPQPIATGGSIVRAIPIVTPTPIGVWIAFGAFSALLVAGFILRSLSTKVSPPVVKRHVGLIIEAARWYCTVVPKTSRDVRERLQGKVVGDSLRIHAHDNVLGDICEEHGGKGHPKSLEVTYTASGHVTANHDEWLVIPQVDKTSTPPSTLIPASASGPAKLTIMEGFLATDKADLRYAHALLRIRVLTSCPDTKLDSWRLLLYFGGKEFFAMDRNQQNIEFCETDPDILDPAVPPPYKRMDRQMGERIESICSREALPIGRDVEGWIHFKAVAGDVTVDDMLGSDFNLSAYASGGQLCKSTIRPGPWRKRVWID